LLRDYYLPKLLIQIRRTGQSWGVALRMIHIQIIVNKLCTLNKFNHLQIKGNIRSGSPIIRCTEFEIGHTQTCTKKQKLNRHKNSEYETRVERCRRKDMVVCFDLPTFYVRVSNVASIVGRLPPKSLPVSHHERHGWVPTSIPVAAVSRPCATWRHTIGRSETGAERSCRWSLAAAVVFRSLHQPETPCSTAFLVSCPLAAASLAVVAVEAPGVTGTALPIPSSRARPETPFPAQPVSRPSAASNSRMAADARGRSGGKLARTESSFPPLRALVVAAALSPLNRLLRLNGGGAPPRVSHSRWSPCSTTVHAC
jgi:hypothetical protein